MNQYILLIVAIIPSIYIGYHLLKADKKDRNNTLVYQLFFIGGALALPIYYIEVFLIESILQTNPFTEAFLVASLIEEGVKFIVLFIIASTIQEKVDNGYYILKKLDTYHYVLLAVAISLGFATIENIVYVINGGIYTGVMRAFSAVPMHACCGYLMGYFYSNKEPGFAVFLLPFGIHGFYNFGFLSEKIPNFIPLIFISIVIWGVIQLQKVVIAFHFSSKEKIKFSWGKNLIKPGLGEVHTINSFNEKFFEVIGTLFFVCVFLVIFFYTSIGDNVINNIRRMLKLILRLFE